MIEMGINDIITYNKYGSNNAQKIVKSLIKQIQKMSTFGASNFLIFNIPDVKVTPSVLEWKET